MLMTQAMSAPQVQQQNHQQLHQQQQQQQQQHQQQQATARAPSPCSSSSSRSSPYSRPLNSKNRSLVCDDCKRKFSRIDAKTRHLSTCPARRTTPPRAGRKVCDGCATAKARCDYGLPCSRCTNRGMDCHYSNPVNRIKKLAAMNEAAVAASVVVSSQNGPALTSSTSTLMPLPMQFMPSHYAPINVPRLDLSRADENSKSFSSLLSPSTIDSFPGLFSNYTFGEEKFDAVYTAPRAASEELVSMTCSENLYSNYPFMEGSSMPWLQMNSMTRLADQPTSFKLSDAVLSAAAPSKHEVSQEISIAMGNDAETTFVKSLMLGFVRDLCNGSPMSTFIHSTNVTILSAHPILAKAITTAKSVMNGTVKDVTNDVRSLIDNWQNGRIAPEGVNAAISAMILYSTITRFHLESSPSWHRDLVAMASGWNLLRSHATQQAMCTINPSHSEWQKWISYETTKRLAFGVYLLDCLYSNQTVYPAELGLELPCNDAAWMASTWLDWATSLASSRSFEAVQRNIIGQLDDPLMQKTFDGLGRFSQILLIARG